MEKERRKILGIEVKEIGCAYVECQHENKSMLMLPHFFSLINLLLLKEIIDIQILDVNWRGFLLKAFL